MLNGLISHSIALISMSVLAFSLQNGCHLVAVSQNAPEFHLLVFYTVWLYRVMFRDKKWPCVVTDRCHRCCWHVYVMHVMYIFMSVLCRLRFRFRRCYPALKWNKQLKVQRQNARALRVPAQSGVCGRLLRDQLRLTLSDPQGELSVPTLLLQHGLPGRLLLSLRLQLPIHLLLMTSHNPSSRHEDDEIK